MAKKKSESEGVNPAVDYYLAPIGHIEVDEGFNVRYEPSDAPGKELLESVATRGVDVPLIVRRKKGSSKLLLVDGHRRYSAALKTGAAVVPVMDCGVLDDLSAIGIAVSANNSRKSMLKIDLVSVCRRLQKLGVTVRDAALKMGMPVSTVGEYFRLAGCADDIREAVKDGKASKRAALESVREKKVTGRIVEKEDPPPPTPAPEPPPVVIERPRVSRVPGTVQGSKQNLSLVMPGENIEREYRLVSDYRERCRSIDIAVAKELRKTPSNMKLVGMQLVVGVLRGKLSVEEALRDWEKA